MDSNIIYIYIYIQRERERERVGAAHEMKLKMKIQNFDEDGGKQEGGDGRMDCLESAMERIINNPVQGHTGWT